METDNNTNIELMVNIKTIMIHFCTSTKETLVDNYHRSVAVIYRITKKEMTAETTIYCTAAK